MHGQSGPVKKVLIAHQSTIPHGTEVMALLCQDRILNISPVYLRPGFAYGGSCLPKDVRALVWNARQSNLHVPLLESLSRSNQLQIEHAYELIARAVQSDEPAV